MPTALHPQARFDPIPPDLDLHALVDRTENFDWVVRVSTAQIKRLGPSGFEKLVQLHVIDGGRPLVIEGWNKVLPDELFSATWLEKTYDKKQENVRDIGSQTDIPMTTGHYLRSMRQLTNQWSPTNFRDERRQRLYLKDIDCPPEWFNHLKKVIPPNVFYLNDNISDNSAANARNDDIFGAPEKTPAVAGDLMSSLDEDMRAQNLMCYIGHEGTFTPAHREMCASLGQNIMVEASGDRHGEKPGSSIWFMTETKDREVVREYFLSMLGHDIEIEKHFAQINAWKKATFPVYIVEQKVGDFILVPPLAPHQVWNRGTRTMKVAWNRTTVETLDLALHEALPKARLVCRDEQYKNKAIIYYTLQKYYSDLQSLEETAEVGLLGLGQELIQNSTRTRQMANDFKRLFGLFTEILVDEMFAYKQNDVEFIPFDSNITCSYCRSNIFNRFLTCKCCVRTLVNGDEDTYDICMECYAMGRSCVCISGLQWCEQWNWADLVDKHETWRAMIIQQDGFVDVEQSPQPIEIARKRTGKRSVAQMNLPEVDEEGRVKKKPKPKRKVKKGDAFPCHVCCHREYSHKLHFCTTCTQAYCYGVLWRAFDMLPQAVMEQEHWQCPRCLNICNCGPCRKAGQTVPYVPKNTLLGHDTRPIADDRSVESIVDFRAHNLHWLKAAGEENRSNDTKRMQRLRQQADAEKAKDPLATLDAEDAPHDMDSALQDSIMNGYGDQSHILGHDGNQNQNGEPSGSQDANGSEEPGSRVEVADMSGLQDGQQDGQQGEQEDSAYPDPSVLNGGRMMGMGFYDQDESTDKILFDAFQMPTADALNEERQVPDVVKKFMRMAKRKARLETDDDPDFRGPRSHPKKKPRTGNIDQLVNLDPALLGSLGEPTSGAATDQNDSAAQSSSGAAAEGETGERETSEVASRPKAVRAPLPVDPLRPTLRHAKPTTSYVEVEEPGYDPEDTVPVKLFGTDDGDNAQSSEKDPVDLAADAIRALTQVSGEGDASEAAKRTEAAKKTPQSSGKKRGRPPSGKKRANVENAEDTTMADADDNEDEEDVTTAELEAQLARELGSATEATDDEDADPEFTPARANPPPARKRGRPPGPRSARKAEPEAAESPPPAPPRDTRYMSMAERMALKGKKVRIGNRKRAQGATTTTSSPANNTSRVGTPTSAKNTAASAKDTDTSMHDASEEEHGRSQQQDDEDFEPEREVSSAPRTTTGASKSNTPGGSTGPTVVRLAFSDDEGDSDSASAPSDLSDDEEDIPATTRGASRALRGRGRGRGGRFATRTRA
ncbi:hypothetical protein F4780DRAFT_767466 [Xylariomycetidae sp. FL0641]|nr:hypothetical protein F4780DRAFT_767466 [Xylariomycetidae sp. FL0641]